MFAVIFAGEYHSEAFWDLKPAMRRARDLWCANNLAAITARCQVVRFRVVEGKPVVDATYFDTLGVDHST